MTRTPHPFSFFGLPLGRLPGFGGRLALALAAMALASVLTLPPLRPIEARYSLTGFFNHFLSARIANASVSGCINDFDMVAAIRATDTAAHFCNSIHYGMTHSPCGSFKFRPKVAIWKNGGKHNYFKQPLKPAANAAKILAIHRAMVGLSRFKVLHNSVEVQVNPMGRAVIGTTTGTFTGRAGCAGAAGITNMGGNCSFNPSPTQVGAVRGASDEQLAGGIRGEGFCNLVAVSCTTDHASLFHGGNTHTQNAVATLFPAATDVVDCFHAVNIPKRLGFMQALFYESLQVANTQ